MLRPCGKWQRNNRGGGWGSVAWFYLAQPSLAPPKLFVFPWSHGSLPLPHCRILFQPSHGSQSLLPLGLSTCSSICLKWSSLSTSCGSFRSHSSLPWGSRLWCADEGHTHSEGTLACTYDSHNHIVIAAIWVVSNSFSELYFHWLHSQHPAQDMRSHRQPVSRCWINLCHWGIQ